MLYCCCFCSADPASVYAPIFTYIILVPIMVMITIYCIKITKICSRAKKFQTKQTPGSEGTYMVQLRVARRSSLFVKCIALKGW